MSALSLAAETCDKLRIAPSLEPQMLVIELAGICDSFAVKPLGEYLSRSAREVERLQLNGVIVDVRQLTLMNSSSLKQFVTFLLPIKLGQVQCKVEFLVDPSSPWQRRCLSALERMCPSSVTIRDAASASLKPLFDQLL